METARNPIAWEQSLLVTFQAAAHSLREIVEDVEAIAPALPGACSAPTTQAGMDVVDVALELPDDAALLNRVIGVIFRAQEELEPRIRVRRVLGGQTRNCRAAHPSCGSQTAAA